MSNFEFDTAYSALTGEHVPGQYIPTVEHSETVDVLIDGVGHVSGPGPVTDWHALTGYTRQYGYRGAIMHASENPTDDQIREWVREAGGDVFALVVVESPCDPCFPDDPDHCVLYGCDATPAGWAIIYREAA